MSLRGQASWAKMMSLRGKLTAPACHLTKYVNKAEQQTYLYKHWYYFMKSSKYSD